MLNRKDLYIEQLKIVEENSTGNAEKKLEQSPGDEPALAALMRAKRLVAQPGVEVEGERAALVDRRRPSVTSIDAPGLASSSGNRYSGRGSGKPFARQPRSPTQRVSDTVRRTDVQVGDPDRERVALSEDKVR